MNFFSFFRKKEENETLEQQEAGIMDILTSDDDRTIEIGERVVRDPSFVPLSQGEFISNRDLNPVKHDQMIQLSIRLWERSAIAKRCIDIRKNVIISEGFDIVAKPKNASKTKELQKFIDKFKEYNKFEKLMDIRIQELLLTGEIILAVSKPNPINGMVKITDIIAENVESVLADPNDIAEMDRIVLKADKIETDRPTKDKSKELLNSGHLDNPDKDEIDSRTFDIIRERKGEIDGDILYFSINRTMGATRGLSDIIHVADWVDVHSRILISEVERARFSRSFVYSVRVQGGKKNVENAKKCHSSTPKPGSILFHTDLEDWKVLQPQLTLFDTVGFLKYIELLILGGMGIPEHWFVEAGSVNKASAAEMDSPIFTWARKVKEQVKDFFALMFKFAIAKAQEEGQFAGWKKEDLEFEIISRDPDRGAYDEIGTMLNQLGTGLDLGVKNGWLDPSDAGQVFRRVAESLGLGAMRDISPEEMKKLKEENNPTISSQNINNDNNGVVNNGEKNRKQVGKQNFNGKANGKGNESSPTNRGRASK